MSTDSKVTDDEEEVNEGGSEGDGDKPPPFPPAPLPPATGASVGDCVGAVGVGAIGVGDEELSPHTASGTVELRFSYGGLERHDGRQVRPGLYPRERVIVWLKLQNEAGTALVNAFELGPARRGQSASRVEKGLSH